MIVPYAPGGTTDVLARMLADHLSRAWNQTVIVENRPGASGNIGATMVANSDPDGHTLLLGLTTVVQVPYLYNKPPFDTFRDLAPITQLGKASIVLAVNTATGIRTVEEYLTLARTAPQKAVYGSYGTGSSGHLYMEALAAGAKVELVHVPYRGEAPVLHDLLSGQVAAGILSTLTAKSHVESGKVRVLGVFGSNRLASMPDVPTFDEQGYQGLDPDGWIGLFSRAGTPKPIQEKIAADVKVALEGPALKARMAEYAITVTGSGPDGFTAQCKLDQDRWAKIIRAANIKLD